MPPTIFVPGSLRDPLDDPLGTERLANVVPIEHCVQFFNDRINLTGPKNRLLILKAGTASAKSTGFVAEMHMNVVTKSPHGRRGMIVTQPRVLTAIKNVSQITSVPKYSHLREGVDIGWSTQYNKLRPKRFGILSATIGTLAAQIILNGFESVVDGYQMICIDETHERSLQTDLVILMLLRLLDKYRDDVRCPFVVFMSATFDPRVFIDYFKKVDDGISLANNFIHVVGQSVGYDVHWPTEVDMTKKLWNIVAAKVEEIIRAGFEDGDDSCDILIFMPGTLEIDETVKALKPIVDKTFAEGLGYTYVMGISSKDVSTESIAYRNLDKKNADIRIRVTPPRQGPRGGAEDDTYIGGDDSFVTPRRKVVISTVIAETGLTLDELKYVIDAGYHRSSLFNPIIKSDTLLTEATPKSRVTQRFGRVGRKTRGVVYPMYTRETFASFPDQQFPEMVTSDFADVALAILDVVRADVVRDDEKKSMWELGLISSPPPSSFQNALEVAYKLGLISPDGVVTDMGKITKDLSVKMPHGRLIAGSIIHGYSTMDIVSLVAFLEEFGGRDLSSVKYDNVYEDIFGGEGKKMRALFADDFIDITILGAWIIRLFDDGIPDVDAIVKEKLGMKAVDVRRFLTRRDQLLITALSIGLDVTKGVSIVPSLTSNVGKASPHGERGETEVSLATSLTILKYVIHDAFKTNILTLKDGAYTYRGMRVAVPSFRRNALRELLNLDEVVYPEKVCFDVLSGEVKGSAVSLTAYRVSAMSGYVYIDEE